MMKSLVALSFALGCLAQFEVSGVHRYAHVRSRAPVRRGPSGHSEELTIYENLQRMHPQNRPLLRLLNENDELSQSLQDENGTYTFFHPTLGAWARYFSYLSRKGKPVNKDFFHETLKYHLLNETIFSRDLASGSNIVHTMMNNATYTNLNGDGQVLDVIKGPFPPIKVVYGITGWKYFQANIILADLKCKNGVIHMVDMVFSFPRYSSKVLTSGNADSFLSAVTAASLNTVIDGASNITIFVPYNEALDKVLASGEVTPKSLQGVLLSHVAHGAFYSTGLSQQSKVTMFSGKHVDVVLEDHSLTVGGSKVVLADVLLRNGVLHVVDKIMTPKGPDAL